MTVQLRMATLAGTLALLLASPVRAETPDEWIKLGARVHGGFGAFIPIGIRIGLDALTRLNAEQRRVTVTFQSGIKAPCPCIVDGVMLATQTSPGQGTVHVVAEKAPAGMLAVIVVHDPRSRETVRYIVKDEWLAQVVEWNRTLDPAGRYQAAMAAVGLFEVSPSP